MLSDRSLGMVAGTATSVFLLTGAFMIMEIILPGDKKTGDCQGGKILAHRYG